MKRLLPILLLGLMTPFLSQVSAQQRLLSFENTRKDFATIAEDGGVVCHTFKCVNTTDRPIIILSVVGGCSCTTANFSRRPIRQNGNGEIEVCFDPMNQGEGKFMRKVVVTTSEGRQTLTIEGSITPRKKSIEEQYPLEIGGGLRIESNSHAFGYVEHGVAMRSSIGVINTSDAPVALSVKADSKNSLLDVRYPQLLAPSESGVIDFGYLIGEGSGVYGSLNDVLSLSIDGKRSRYSLIISGIAVDRRQNSTNKEWQKIQLSENFIKFGTLKRGGRAATRTVEILNVGLEPLIIRKVESLDGVLDVKLEGADTIYKDGKSLLRLTVEPSKYDYGAVSERVRIISNDPQQPAKSFRVSVIIED